MFTLESISEMRRNKSVFTMNDNIPWCDGAGDHKLNIELSQLNVNESAQSLSVYFQQIHELIKKLEFSLAISRQLENQEAIRLTVLQAENIRLSNQIEQLSRQKQVEENVETSDPNKILNDDLRIYEPCATMSIVNLQYKYNELWDSYQKILQTLTNKDKQLKSYKDKVDDLQAQLNETKNLNIEKDFKIYELCIKYLRLKGRRDQMEQNMEKEINSLQLFLYRTMKKLADYITNYDVVSQNERSQTGIKPKFLQILHKSLTH